MVLCIVLPAFVVASTDEVEQRDMSHELESILLGVPLAPRVLIRCDCGSVRFCLSCCLLLRSLVEMLLMMKFLPGVVVCVL
jgi:hypothetical protein